MILKFQVDAFDAAYDACEKEFGDNRVEQFGQLQGWLLRKGKLTLEVDTEARTAVVKLPKAKARPEK